MTTKRPSVTIHRNTETGRIVPAKEVVRHPANTVTEHYPRSGNGTVTMNRDAKTGRLVTPAEVARHPKSTVTEHYKRR